MDHQLFPFRRVLLWAAPRSLSNAFERSIRELKSVKVFHEPHCEAYYYGPERKRDNTHQPTQSEIEDNIAATFEAVDAELLRHHEGYEAVFAKDLAYYIEGRYDNYVKGDFANFKHTFLIRHPQKSIPSLIRAYKRCGFSSTFDDNGIKALYDFYKIVQQNVDPHPIVIDADDLLANPKGFMEHYCRATGLRFEEQMLTWTPGDVQDWMPYKYTHVFKDTVMNSSGFMKPQEKPRANDMENLSKEAQDFIQQMLPYYEAMYSVRLQL